MLQKPGDGTGQDTAARLRFSTRCIQRHNGIAFHGNGVSFDQLQHDADQSEKHDPRCDFQGGKKIAAVGQAKSQSHKNKHGDRIGHHAEYSEHHAAHSVTHRTNYTEITQKEQDTKREYRNQNDFIRNRTLLLFSSLCLLFLTA